MKKKILALFKKNNADEKVTFDASEIIKQTAKAFKALDGNPARNVPAPFFITSKGDYIDLRPNQFVSNEKETSTKTKDGTKFTVKQIALKLAYEDVNVTKENADEIIKEYGYTSGHNLYQEYNKVSNSKKRITDPDKTLKILENKIHIFESVTEILIPEYKAKAIDEIKILKSHLSKY